MISSTSSMRRNLETFFPVLPVLSTMATIMTPMFHSVLHQAPFGSVVLGWFCAIATSLAIATLTIAHLMIVVVHTKWAAELRLVPPDKSVATVGLVTIAAGSILLGVIALPIALQ